MILLYLLAVNLAAFAAKGLDKSSAIRGVEGVTYTWPRSTYIAEPPFFHGFALDSGAASAHQESAGGQKSTESVMGARIMALFGDSITTDHISPAGSI